jgi:hypothetical protein
MKPVLALFLGACTATSSLSVDPPALDFGDVDFQQPQPTGGYDAITLRIRNDAKRPAVVTVRQFDEAHLVLAAFTTSNSPPTLPALEPGAETTIAVGVGGYDLGERDQLVEGSFDLLSDLDRVAFGVSWSFTPIRDIGGDTGQ